MSFHKITVIGHAGSDPDHQVTATGKDVTNFPLYVNERFGGEEHTIRSSAEPEYTVRCAEYVDRRIREIKKQVGHVEGHKLAILASLSITDELLQVQDTQAQNGSEIAARVNALAARLEDTPSGG